MNGGEGADTGVGHFTLPGQKRARAEAAQKIRGFVKEYGVTAIAIGNGTASRESEQFIVSLLPEMPGVAYMIVSEAGASVYSASKLAAEEFPDFDVTQRSAVSIARRMQDPLAELVKIDPKAIGVGQYQHDLKEKELTQALDGGGGAVREPGRRGGIHRLGRPSCCPMWRASDRAGEEHRGLSGGKRHSFPRRPEKGAQAGPQGF